MGWNDPDPYNQPEKFGLTIIDTLDDPEADYSFDYLVVWQHEDGRLFWAQDSGCSCPSPFEDYNAIEDLTPIIPGTFSDFIEAVTSHCCGWKDPEAQATFHRQYQDFYADKMTLLAKVANLLDVPYVQA